MCVNVFVILFTRYTSVLLSFYMPLCVAFISHMNMYVCSYVRSLSQIVLFGDYTSSASKLSLYEICVRVFVQTKNLCNGDTREKSERKR